MQEPMPVTLLKRVSGTGVFLLFCEISNNTLFYRTPSVVASVVLQPANYFGK